MKTSKILPNNPFQRSILNTFILIPALFLAVILSPPAYSHGQGAEKSAEAVAAKAEQKNRAKELTQQLGDLMAEYKTANVTDRSELAKQLNAFAEERWQLLGELIENDSAEVLKQALPDDVLDQMPAKAQAFLEQRLEMEGELQLLHVDYQDNKQSHYVYLFSTDNGERYSLHFDKNGRDIQSGTRVRVNGLALYGIKARDAGETEGAVAVDNEDNSLILLEAGGTQTTTTTSTTTASLPNTLGAQKTLVILVNFSDNATQPYTTAAAQSAVFGTANNFFLENSYQQTSLTGDVVGWFTIASSSTVCDSGAIASAAKTAASKVVNLSAYAHLVYAFPQNNTCGWGGMSTVGGSPSQSWINGNLTLRVVAHELGHGLGLWHSHSMDCGDAPLGPVCTTSEYGDTLDLMGTAQSAHYTAFQKERLGWLTPQTVMEDGTYTLNAYEVPGATLALKILKATDATTGKKTWFYLEARKPIGFDNTLTYAGMTDGVAIHLGSESSGNTSYMLDMTPNSRSNDRLDPALVAGQTFNHPESGVTITTESVTSTGAAVTILFGSGTGSQTTATMTVSTDQASYTRSQTVSITGKMISSTGSPISGAAVTFTITKSNGAVITVNATTGSGGTAIYNLRLKKQDPVGIYQAKAMATKDGLSSGGAANFTVK